MERRQPQPADGSRYPLKMLSNLRSHQYRNRVEAFQRLAIVSLKMDTSTTFALASASHELARDSHCQLSGTPHRLPQAPYSLPTLSEVPYQPNMRTEVADNNAMIRSRDRPAILRLYSWFSFSFVLRPAYRRRYTDSIKRRPIHSAMAGTTALP